LFASTLGCFGVQLALVSGCGESAEATCARDSECVSSDGVRGRCLASPVDEDLWCAYPDPTCDDGYRWSSVAGSGLAGSCAIGCLPRSCGSNECGVVDDGCGETLDCGGCAAPDTCGGGGEDNVCGCSPVTCDELGAECGVVPDGCGGMLSCGGCSDPEKCGGAGVSNRCGCTPATTCEEVSAECGNPSDGCYGTLSCPYCEISGAWCIDFECKCAPAETVCETTYKYCANLATDPDNCAACGSGCSPGNVCSAGSCVPGP